tara:strand:- start:326 stop:700 length:375 start_codon:yes stop_codon:yes gene_type:complete
MTNPTSSNLSQKEDLGPWSQPPTTIRIEDLTKEINEVKAKKNELARKEKELLEKFKNHVEKEGLDAYEDAEENRFSIGEVLIEKREREKWTYSQDVEQLKIKEQKLGRAVLSITEAWYFSEAKK